MAASEELVGNNKEFRHGKLDSPAEDLSDYGPEDAPNDAGNYGVGKPRTDVSARVEDLAQSIEDRREYGFLEADRIRDSHAPAEPELPVFWDGTPHTLRVGMVCRDSGLSVQVLDIKHCTNGAVILGMTIINGEAKMYNVTQPEPHPLSRHESATPEQREFIRKLWEYDTQ